jgi:hypothetical protein
MDYRIITYLWGTILFRSDVNFSTYCVVKKLKPQRKRRDKEDLIF